MVLDLPWESAGHDRGTMTSIDSARAIYEDTVSTTERGARELAQELKERAQELREQGVRSAQSEVRVTVAMLMQEVPPEEREEAADHLEQAGDDLQETLGDENPVMKKLPGDTGAQAELQSNKMWVDPTKLMKRDGDRIVDREIAQDERAHEHEHNLQSQEADAGEIAVGGRTLEAWEVREAAAISVQRRRDFLSTEYRSIIASLPMNDDDRLLVRAGKFRELEAKKNGQEREPANAMAA